MVVASLGPKTAPKIPKTAKRRPRSRRRADFGGKCIRGVRQWKKVEKAEKEIQDFEEKQAEIDKLKEEIADVEDDYEFHEKKGQHSQTDSNFRKNEMELLDENAKDNI